MEELIRLIRTLDESNSRDKKLIQCLSSLVKGHKKNINIRNEKL